MLSDCTDKVFDNFPILDNNRNKRISSLATRLLLSEKTNFLNHCEYFISHFLLFFAGCFISDSEGYYQTEKEIYNLNGYVDIVLKDKDNNHIIVDYKTKNTPDRKECTGQNDNDISDFQIPVYITLVEEKENVRVTTALFYGIVNTKPEVIIGIIRDINTEKIIPAEKNQIECGSEEYNMIFNEFNTKAELFAKEISSCNFSVFSEDINQCFSCKYHRICRTVYIISHEPFFTTENS